MTRSTKYPQHSSQNDRGASLVEYGVVLGLVGLVATSASHGIGEEISNLFDGVASSVAFASITVSSDTGNPYDPDAFVFEVSTATGAVFPSAGGTIEIDWGDETANSTCTTTYVINPGSYLTCAYPEAGTYQISITGDMSGYGHFSSSAYKSDITRLLQWGNTGLNDLTNSFYGAVNLADVPGNLPPGVTNLTGSFQFATTLNDPDISSWDTSNVTSVERMFADATSFDQDLNGWNVSSVTSFQSMFNGATAFSPGLPDWDTSSATSFGSMFRSSTYNGDIAAWDTSSVESMYGMFYDNGTFNRDISGWDVSQVQSFGRMFRNASSFSQDISGWDVSSATNMLSMFNSASSFSADLSAWDVSSVTNMEHMFYMAPGVAADLSGWCVPLMVTPQTAFSTGSSIVADPVWGSCP